MENEVRRDKIEQAARLCYLYWTRGEYAERCVHAGITAEEAAAGRRLREQREKDHAVRCAVYGSPEAGWAEGARLTSDSEDEIERARR